MRRVRFVNTEVVKEKWISDCKFYVHMDELTKPVLYMPAGFNIKYSASVKS